MGDIWLPDKAVSRYVIDGSFWLLGRDWSDIWEHDKNDVFALRRVATAACVILAGYFGGLRGDEINRVDLGVTRKHWEEATRHVGHPNVPLMLTGKFKKQKGLKLFSQPLASVTRDGRKIELWFYQMMFVLKQVNITTGPMFVTSKGKAMSIAEMDTYFIPTLLAVQRKFSHIIPDTFDVAEFYSVYRSLRRGATSKALNVRIPEAVINMNNKWRKEMQNPMRGGDPEPFLN